MSDPELLYKIGLTLIPGVGDVLGKKLVSVFGNAEAIFREPGRHLKRMARVGALIAQAVGNREILSRAERELCFIEKYGITPLFFTDPRYPQRLRQCFDSPVMLYYKGNATLSPEHALGIVGTRNATEYGKIISRKIVEGLVSRGVMVVSGLAYGIDSCAHRAALEFGLETVGVLGHGLDRIYPFQNKPLAEKMMNQGGLLTEFLSESKPDRENFPRRNRIIAGLCEAVVVVEAAQKGGALITADIANSYNRDVFAVPGRIGDPYSEGTNFLIRTNRAALIQGPEDIEMMMGWQMDEHQTRVSQPKLWIELTPEEEKIVALLHGKGSQTIDDISLLTGISISKTSSSLLNLEFEGKLKCLPGRVYTLL